MNSLDPKDIQLLSALQRNALIPATELSETLGMSASQIGRRRLRLEQAGVIAATVARLHAKAVGLSVQAFIQIQTEAQNETTHSAIQQLVKREPAIVGAWTLTGEADYMFRVYCPDLAALNNLVQLVLLPHPSIGRVQSQIVMDDLKDDTALPVSG